MIFTKYLVTKFSLYNIKIIGFLPPSPTNPRSKSIHKKQRNCNKDKRME